MELLRFCAIFAIFIKTETYSLFTDIEDQNSTALENNRREMKDMDVLRQIINQETVIRLALTKNVHVLLNDVQYMKRTMASTAAMVSSLQKTIATLTIRMDTLQQENQNLKDNNVKCHRKIEEIEQQFKTVDQNITTITENQISIVRQNDEKRENIANKTNKVVGDIKMEVRYLSVTLLDLKEKIEKEHRIKDEKSNEIESFWKFEHSETRRTFSNLSALFRNLENSQSEMNRTLMENLNNTVGRLESQVKKTKDEQLKLSSAVASLEVFRMNVSKSTCDNELNVAFTAGIKSGDSSWSGSTLVFPHVIFNEGGGYDSNTGVFTALSTGTYVFYISIQSAFRKYIHLDIVLNGSAKVRALAWYNSGSKIEIHQTGTNLVVLPLNKADRVWVKRGGGTGYYSDGHHITTFSGFRLF